MRSATRSSAAVAAVLALTAGVRWWSAPPAPLTASQVLALLPPGSSVHSLVRLDLDGAPPAETAVVARIPRFPGARTLAPTALLYRYDRWRRRFREVYRAPTPGTVPFSADAARLLEGRDAAIFSGLHDDGTQEYRVIGLRGGAPAVLREARFLGTLHVVEPLLVERRRGETRAWRWQDGRWTAADPPEIPAAPPGVSWRYTVRNGRVVARQRVVSLRPRQPLRVLAVGGGPATVVLPDPGLDVAEAGFRQRTPGVYRIRIVTPYAAPETAFVLTVIVSP
ncbi:MAG: hypothetical protein QN141_02555 [Armatimonadota bacterium]|nr:hypothetical protein [Armatimonadota bacterium]MDR7450781.1 hypothetical protein [Armatimonadota bacterium]MDR7466137.1 hypothetical protein [Armatimonadota bacterium]MDR7493826.1 hypothetical protein [Armatimonadota bacterium]MDR7499013.1 hypothetical protein [Armatimonadota bacterium]